MTTNIIEFPEVKIITLAKEYLHITTQFLYHNWHLTYDEYLPKENISLKTYDNFYRYLAKNKSNTFIAIKSNEIIGLVTIFKNCIDELWVHKGFRRQGIAKKLLKQAVDRILDKNYLMAQVGCEDFNSDAIYFFKALGWYMIDFETIELNNDKSISVMVLGFKLT
ncbi:MAG: GNAT family N-acetyltransferase [Gammaproteobacteria bacterium]|nr:GNAT family N-acetyltransferase [Gammaproteobacteria bacterium]